MGKRTGPLETVPIEKSPVEPHDYDEDSGTDRCGVCKTPKGNRLHDPKNRRAQPTREQHRADLARLGEREDED